MNYKLSAFADESSNAFSGQIDALKRNGFESYTIFRNRQPIQIPIDQQIAPLYKK